MITAVGEGGRPTRSGSAAELADEAALIRRCRAGERRAQEAFYRRYRQQVAANLYRVTCDGGDLEDLVQEVFIIAFRGLDRFRGEARLSTWLYRICINVALGRVRQRSRRPAPIPSGDCRLAESVESSPEHPQRVLERQQDQIRVREILASLPAKKRIVLYLHEIEGLDLKDIAYLVDAHPVTVRTRLHYARKEFYRRVAEGGE